MLLARTAVVYGQAVDRKFRLSDDRERVRQRLANTLFAQLLAGSGREREGPIGTLLKAIAWLTLVLGPIALLLFFELRFLPFHSHFATWCHRLFIAIDLAAIFLLGSSAPHPQRDIGLIDLARRWWVISSLALVMVAATCFILTFPSESHAPLTRFTRSAPAKTFEYDARTRRPDICDRVSIFAFLLPDDFDRLRLDGESFVDPNQIEEIALRN